MLTLRDRLRDASKEKEKKIITHEIISKTHCDENSISFFENDYNTVILPILDRQVIYKDLSTSDDFFFLLFDEFLKSVKKNDSIFYYVRKNDSYYFIKIEMNLIKKYSSFFWTLKGDSADCILFSEEYDFGFCKLYTEYNYELYEWNDKIR